jgi:hypothetical protein
MEVAHGREEGEVGVDGGPLEAEVLGGGLQRVCVCVCVL